MVAVALNLGTELDTGFAGAQAGGASGARPSLRLVDGAGSRPGPTVLRRRRLAALVLAVLLLVAVDRLVGATLGSSASAGAAPDARVPVVLVAQPGDTYWSLAGRLGVGGDLRSTVDALVRANGGHDLRAGDRIHLAP